MPDDTSNGGGDDRTPPFSSDGSGEDGPIGELFEALADPRSRYVLSYLESISVDVVELADVADHVVECETAAPDQSDPDRSGPDSERHRQRVAVSLHHNHLPKLDDAAVIDYDPRTKAVRYWGDDRVASCLDLFESVENA
ncbi:DUF7344 domain-containing protein [Halorussus salinisoli]|uniref:DUF7344 domain-containing protein n=1 Tax=Halorussus salinisoli TaxID=2558242 RepID=UPI0010C21F73|nr:hypothetical protein [Halorussus salinisoli]